MTTKTKTFARRCKNQKDFSCTMCVKPLNSVKKCGSPAKVHNRPYRCSKCPQNFRSKDTLQQHLNDHAGKKPFLCSICNKGFKNNQTLKEHTARHNNEILHTCPHCKRGFIHASAYSRHLLTHKKELSFMCSRCGKQFRDSSCLTSHMRSHTGVKPYTCSVCEKSFGHRQTLRRHLILHSGKKPFRCKTCKRPFADQSSCRHHERRHLRTSKSASAGNDVEKVPKLTLCTGETGEGNQKDEQNKSIDGGKMTINPVERPSSVNTSAVDITEKVFSVNDILNVFSLPLSGTAHSTSFLFLRVDSGKKDVCRETWIGDYESSEKSESDKRFGSTSNFQSESFDIGDVICQTLGESSRRSETVTEKPLQEIVTSFLQPKVCNANQTCSVVQDNFLPICSTSNRPETCHLSSDMQLDFTQELEAIPGTWKGENNTMTPFNKQQVNLSSVVDTEDSRDKTCSSLQRNNIDDSFRTDSYNIYHHKSEKFFDTATTPLYRDSSDNITGLVHRNNDVPLESLYVNESGNSETVLPSYSSMLASFGRNVNVFPVQRSEGVSFSEPYYGSDISYNSIAHSFGSSENILSSAVVQPALAADSAEFKVSECRKKYTRKKKVTSALIGRAQPAEISHETVQLNNPTRHAPLEDDIVASIRRNTKVVLDFSSISSIETLTNLNSQCDTLSYPLNSALYEEISQIVSNLMNCLNKRPGVLSQDNNFHKVLSIFKNLQTIVQKHLSSVLPS